MTPKEYLAVMHCIAGLKERTRHAWMKSGRQESVAEHSWRMALMAYFLRDAFPSADLTRVLLMALLHDMGEVFTGDIPTFEKTNADRAHEHCLRDAWIDSLPAPYAAEVRDLFAEMDACETEEARLVKALDRMEAVITHNEGDPTTWLPLEYDLQRTYGIKEAAFSPALKELRAEVNNEVDAVIALLAKEKKI
ncbi:HD domain-containing protein [Selenomonas sp. oral taxon 136]|uniref:HD domain-containing protein n=1 Tax=Selenomonas sp. oral taxon 136 TaxID=713030 RepID=UPI00076838F4|nr:HD domain-containing protein [Selenomonas sp. oral taxon 136]AME03361.1 phosphohydrolase [Selenomonas sp. oral taxon 136]